MKRQRGRGRKPGGGNQGNRSHESNGPEVKIRGTAAQIHEKYVQYARDAQSAGDRVRYENLMQHAEHYFRTLAATMPKDRLPGQQPDNNGQRNGPDGEGDDTNNEAEASGSDNETEAETSEAPAEASEEGGEGSNRPRRRRGRRRPPQDGEAAAAESDGEARSALDDLARKQAAVAGG